MRRQSLRYPAHFFQLPSEDPDQFGSDWINQYNTDDNGVCQVCVYWWYGIAGSANHGWSSGKGCTWVGYKTKLVDAENRIYMATVPNDGNTPLIIWNNGVNGGMDDTKEIFNYGRQLAEANIEGAFEGDYDTLPEGTPNEDNMDGCIQIIDYSVSTINPLTGFPSYGSNWYVYYGNGCYGEYPMDSDNYIDNDHSCRNPEHFDEYGNHIAGSYNTTCNHWNTYTETENFQDYGDSCSYDLVTYCYDCGREIYREHKEVLYPTGDGVIYFDAASAGWENASNILFYIYEITDDGYGQELAAWGSRKRLGGIYIGNNIWAFDAANLGVTEGKEYGIIMNNYDTNAQTYDLLLNSSCFGDTIYANPDVRLENPVDSYKTSMEARWRSSSLGPRLQITSIGNVVGESIPANTPAYQMMVNFLATRSNGGLYYARYWSDKDVQSIIDDVAAALGLTKYDVSRAITEAGDYGDAYGDRYDWSYSWSYDRSTLPLPAPVDIPDEDGLILFDAASAGWENANVIQFDIYDLDDNRLPAKSTPDEIRGTKSYDDIWFFNAQKRGVQEGQVYYIIFRNAETGERTGSLILDTTCYGDKAYCDGSTIMEEVPSSYSSDGTQYYSDCYPRYDSYPAAVWTDPHDINYTLNGTVGSSNLIWTLENGVLTISGSGPLDLAEPEAVYSSGSINNIKSNRTKRLWNKLGFTDLVIEDGVTNIVDNVFTNCSSLKTVTIGNSVTSIGASAFENCSALESIKIGNSVTSVGQHAFADCVGLKSAVIGNSLTKIDKYTFENCSALKNVTIGSSVMGIAQGAFIRCSKLESIALSDSVQIIANEAFSHCANLTNITIPDSVTDIGERAFYDCPKLKSVTVPASVTNIDTKAFGYYWNDDFGITLKIPGFTIYGDVCSDAQRYAKTYGFRFERAIAMTGDADGDGTVTVMDVTGVQHDLSHLQSKADEDITPYVDVDHNDLLEIIDATYIQRYVAGIDTMYDIGEILYNKYNG